MHTYRIHFFEEWGDGRGQHTVHHITHLRRSEREREESEQGVVMMYVSSYKLSQLAKQEPAVHHGGIYQVFQTLQ